MKTIRLSRMVNGKYIVRNINIEINKGDILAIIGPSGAGKTSFLRLINRLDEPSEGTVFIKGKDYRLIPPRELRRQIGMVMQTPFLFPGDVAFNIRYGPAQIGEGLSREDVEYLLSKVGLGGYSHRDISKLSGGEAQRVALARTLANNPEILLLDEPTSSLDKKSKEEIEALIMRIIKENNITCIMVTHDIQQVSRIATRIMMMEHGELLQFGIPAEVIQGE